jgi:hypothetical protein
VNDEFLKVICVNWDWRCVCFQFYQSHLVPHAREDQNLTAEDVRRNLNLVDNIDEDYENVSLFGGVPKRLIRFWV